MTTPFVGLPETVENDRCSYAPDIDQPRCDRPAVVHLAVESAAWGVVGLAACPEHERIARGAGELLGEHFFGDACCGLTGECWS